MINMFISLHVKYRCYSCPILIKLEFTRQFFRKLLEYEIEMTKLIVTFRNFENAPKIVRILRLCNKATVFLKSILVFVTINIILL